MNDQPFRGLLIRFRGDVTAAAPALQLASAGTGIELEPLFSVESAAPGASGVAAGKSSWYLARPTRESDANPWEAAYEAMSRRGELGLAAGAEPELIEPELVQQWIHDTPESDSEPLAAADGTFNDQIRDLPRQPGVFAWHLDDRFSQLRRARQQAAAAVAAGAPAVRIVHLDTGYDPDHVTFPERQVDLHLQRNFIEGNSDARDPNNRGPLRHPGHGTGTLSILAGAHFRFSNNDYQFDEVLGGAPFARIVPVRVGNSVVQLYTSSVARGISYAAQLCNNPATRVDVISMSMGGVASAAWADAVNDAYRAGVVFVAAAGNNFARLPTRFVVYPARFGRVIAACGVMADRKPYWGLPARVMQGNWGPKKKMRTAMAAFTPNMPWAELGARDIVDMDGQGTSSATPQVAAAAAIYLQAHARELFDPSRYPQPWMRVEAVRHALFSSAENRGVDLEKLGLGVLRAADALGIAPPRASTLNKMERDSATFAFLRGLTGVGAAESPLDRMLAIEATQLSQRWPMGDGDNPFDAADDLDDESAMTPKRQQRFFAALIDHPLASRPLKRRAEEAYRTLGGRSRSRGGGARDAGGGGAAPRGATGAPAPPSAADLHPASPPFAPPPPPFRPLRGFAFDPSLSTRLETVGISEVLFKVPWEKDLAPGPVDEYIEVIDVDPPSNHFYDPVDLNHESILAQNGLPPSEGTPQFHQQMAYAVARLTIDNFEHGLGRRILWRPKPNPKKQHDDSIYVPRLRIYPHALREPNAYYSPQKIALLFGYFTASGDDPGGHLPGAHVFTCLSHDIIAHETTHALLDGMHRKYLVASNPDVRAFHEALADIVALFQHFTFPEILRHQIAATRGQIRSQQSLLGALATEFGRTTGRRGALRDAIGKIVDGKWVPHDPKPNEYLAARSPHERGSFLVAAVFDAFLSIYENRVSDLLRLATGGRGILEPGAIHPDLVNRLAAEAAKSAQHVLTMCIRALDYCPPTDITFGEYLRAVITADYDLVPDDDLNYRVAFIEAFRRRGIYPRDVRALSVESLLWRGPANSDPPPSNDLSKELERLRPFAGEHMYADTRREIFELQYGMRKSLHGWLKAHFARGPLGRQDAMFLGVDPDNSFEVHTARVALRNSPDGGVEPQLIIGLLQRKQFEVDPNAPHLGQMTFEGGSTVIAELKGLRVRYCVRKRMDSRTRLDRQRSFKLEVDESARTTYLSGLYGDDDEGDEPFALLHRGF